jgi:hypothetical protein
MQQYKFLEDKTKCKEMREVQLKFLESQMHGEAYKCSGKSRMSTLLYLSLLTLQVPGFGAQVLEFEICLFFFNLAVCFRASYLTTVSLSVFFIYTLSIVTPLKVILRTLRINVHIDIL